MALLIDSEIHSHYKLYPINYITLDTLEGGKRGLYDYSAEDEAKALKYIESRIDLIKLPDGLALDRTFLRHCLLTMYANPVRSMLQARQGSIANSGA